MSADTSIFRTSSSMFELPLKDWFLYLYLIVSPFYMYAVLSDRDWPAMWIVSAMGALMLVEIFRNGGRVWIDQSFMYLWLFLVMYVASTFVVLLSGQAMNLMGRNSFERAFTTLLRLVYVVCAYVVFVSFLADGTDRTFRRIFAVQMGVGLVVAFFGIIQYVSTVFLGSTALTEFAPTSESYRLYSSFSGYGSQRFYRSAAFFAEPSAFGFFLVPFLTKAVVARARGVILGGPTIHLAIIVTFIVAILFNLSMTAVLSTIILMTLFAVNSLRGSRHFWKYVALCILVIGVIMLTPAGSLVLERLDRVFGLQDVSTLDRLTRVFVGLQVFVGSPIIGVGPGGFAFRYATFGHLAFGGLASPLNVWVTFLTDAGILGLIPFILFLANVLRRGLRARAKHPLVSVYLWGILSLLVLLTTLDGWYWETLWFDAAVLVALTGSPSLREDTVVQSPRMP